MRVPEAWGRPAQPQRRVRRATSTLDLRPGDMKRRRGRGMFCLVLGACCGHSPALASLHCVPEAPRPPPSGPLPAPSLRLHPPVLTLTPTALLRLSPAHRRPHARRSREQETGLAAGQAHVPGRRRGSWLLRWDPSRRREASSWNPPAALFSPRFANTFVPLCWTFDLNKDDRGTVPKEHCPPSPVLPSSLTVPPMDMTKSRGRSATEPRVTTLSRHGLSTLPSVPRGSLGAGGPELAPPPILRDTHASNTRVTC